MTPSDASVPVERVPADTLRPPLPAPGSLVSAVAEQPDALLYVLLNVGDGDTQLLVLPADREGRRRLVVVDVATTGKLPALLQSLHDAGILTEAPGAPGQVALLVATHPHQDHIGGLPELLRRFEDRTGWIDQVWEPGYHFPGPSFHRLMHQLEESRACVRRLQPTAGTALFLDAVKITVIGPGIGLRNHFDTFGVDINDASITLMVEYPAALLYVDPDPDNPGRVNRRSARRNTTRLLLGADAQFTSWAQATVDFPDLSQEHNEALARELRAAQGPDYLAADVLKMSHHGSKHGVNLELLERVGADQTLVSATAGDGSYRFPHLLAMEAVREARQATAGTGAARKSDHELGIHLTGALLDDPACTPLGSIALVVQRDRRKPRIFRLLDRPAEDVDLDAAREVVA